MSSGNEDLNALVRDLGMIAVEAVPKIHRVVSKGSLNVKKAMQADASKSRHFGQIARSIDYEVTASGGTISGEIGPNKARDPSASLAGIAYFGTSRGGGATVRNPEQALADETPKFIEEIQKLAGEGL